MQCTHNIYRLCVEAFYPSSKPLLCHLSAAEHSISLFCFCCERKTKLCIGVCIQKHSLGSFLGDKKGNLGRPHFFPWGQYVRHSKQNVSSLGALTNWPGIQLILIYIREPHTDNKMRITIMHGGLLLPQGKRGEKKRWVIRYCTCCCNDWKLIWPLIGQMEESRWIGGGGSLPPSINITLNKWLTFLCY